MYAKLGNVSATDEDINDKTKLKFKIVDKSKYSFIPNFIHVTLNIFILLLDDLMILNTYVLFFLFNVKSKMLKFKMNGNYGSIHSS